MPLYEYECDACGHRFEKIRMYSDPPLNECPKCGATVHKLQSAPAIQFKGTGFYITDYAKKASPESSTSASQSKPTSDKSSSDSSSSSSSSSSESSSKSDSKPAADKKS